MLKKIWLLLLSQAACAHQPQVAHSKLAEISQTFYGKLGYILLMFAIAFIVGFVYRFLLRSYARNTLRGTSKNIDRSGRLKRAGIGLFLLILAICTTWSPIVLFFSGFCFFEAIFSWCGLNAALGKSDCPL